MSQSRPSGGSSASRPSGYVSRPSGSAHAPGSVSQSRPSGSGSSSARRPGGYHDNSYGHSRPSGDVSRGTTSHSRPADDVRGRGAVVPNGGDRHASARPDGGHAGAVRRPEGHSAPARGHVEGSRRPAPGSRPYVDGAYGGRRPSGTPARVGVHNRPGGPAHHAPSHREFNGRPAHFHVRGPHHYGHYIPGPPPRYKLYHYWGRDYYYYDNIWYRYYGGRYWICRPPWGYVFSPLADAVFTACEFAYYFYRIHYYNSVSENAQTIAAQNEAIAANNAVLASQNEAIARNTAAANAAGDLASSLGLVQSYANAGIEYYYNDGVFYVKDADGQYTVIVPPAGALVETLPEDYEIVTLGGKEYYKVDDTIYRMVVIDNKAMFEVLGQLVS